TPAGAATQLQLAKGESGEVGGATVRFVGFDLEAGGTNALAQMTGGGMVTLGARLEVTHDGASETLVPLYKFNGAGRVEAPPTPLPGGGQVLLTAIDATRGTAQLDFFGLPGGGAGTPARLSVDVTQKPLIQLVWYGLYVVLAGGILATGQRLREALLLERLGAAKGAGKGSDGG
ncbi:MAG TPA: hypothetical protein VMT16_16010, partial [Thermoanaerobaculia bacterium]|nr:hypothetical protein [Thermoanaerobaculia bacterium]